MGTALGCSARRWAAPHTPLVLCGGPEGGWTDGELDAAREAKATLIGVGRHTLRIETAALALAALVSASRKVEDCPDVEPGFNLDRF